MPILAPVASQPIDTDALTNGDYLFVEEATQVCQVASRLGEAITIIRHDLNEAVTETIPLKMSLIEDVPTAP